ncbi:MAG TPA: Rv3235 family protein [Egibacteraceae bacterium]|nr:Rv3235 family protein [Egibacteraceae bacterium]
MTLESEADPLILALAFAQLYLEVECGRRPRATVEPLMTPRLAGRLGDGWVRGGPMRRPGAARGSLAAPDAFEAAVTAHGPQRTGVLALRLERRAAGWRVTEVVRPEDGALPEAEPPPLERIEVESPDRWSDEPGGPDITVIAAPWGLPAGVAAEVCAPGGPSRCWSSRSGTATL